MTSIAVVAHPRRTEMAEKLAHRVCAESILWDEYDEGCEMNHLGALCWLAEGSTDPEQFKVVLEDDARPCDGFNWQLIQVLAVAPTDVVSLYLGTGYPQHWQQTLRTAVVPIDADPHFLTASELLSCVGYAIRAKYLGPLIDRLRQLCGVPIDAAITQFCQEQGLLVSYTRPSLVNHIGRVSLIPERADGQDRRSPRHAWKFGTRSHWEPSTMAIPEPRLVSVDTEGKRWYEQKVKQYG